MDEELAIISAKVTPHPPRFSAPFPQGEGILSPSHSEDFIALAISSDAVGFIPSMTDLTAFLTPLRNAWLRRSAGSELSRAGGGI